MDYYDQIPVKDSDAQNESKGAFTQKAARERIIIGKFNRNDLEDKYLRLYEENLLLKKHARKQDDKIKRMATKILRLVGDKKKSEQTQGVKKVRDIETEEMLEELHGKIRDLDKQNQNLKEKLLVAKQQVMTQPKRATPYNHVSSRINTGISKTMHDPRIAKNMHVSGPVPYSRQAHSPLPRYGHSLLEEARAEIAHLEMEMEKQNERLNMANMTIDELKEEMQIRESEFEDDLLKIKQQMNLGQRATVQENIDIIRLQREIKEKSTKLTALQSQYQGLEDKLREVKESHNNLLHELESTSQQLKNEQSKSLTLSNQLKAGSSAQRRVVELQERISDIERECDILKEANEKLVNSAFDLEREREWRMRENALKVQIAQLEATLKADVGEKGSILDKLTDERDVHEQLHEDHKNMRVQYYQLKQEHDELKEKMSFFTQESEIDFQEIEEALMIVKQRKNQTGEQLDFLQKVDDEHRKDFAKEIKELHAEHAETINELEKTRNMLIVQHKINSNYHAEVEAVSNKMETNRLEFEAQITEYAQLLDIRAARIRKLEAQLRDVAYGTRQHALLPDPEDSSDVEDLQDTIQLERDQNLFEIHIKKIVLSQEAVRVLDDDEPALFATYEFYEFETQSTPVMKGKKLDYSFTSQYLVKMDDFFLHYLQKESTTLELHQSFGTDYRTVAVGRINMKGVLEKSQSRLHGTATLTGIELDGQEGSGINFGTLDFWIALRVPMEQAMRCYKERSKALGYISINQSINEQQKSLQAMDETVQHRPPDNVNILEINIKRCMKVKARREGIQPSPYVVYKFFDFPDHDTAIIPSSDDPQYNDHKTFPVPMAADLDKYLKTYPLQIYVFDDTDPDDTSYLGLATIALIQLAHDKPVKGIFELKTKEGNANGSIEVSLTWKYMYIPPKISAKTKEQLTLLSGSEHETEGLELMPGEDEALKQSKMLSSTASSTTRVPTIKLTQSMSIPEKQNRLSVNQNTMQSTLKDRDLSHQNEKGELSLENSNPSINVTHSLRHSTIQEESDNESSIATEGSHVDGESDLVSSSHDSTPRDRQLDDDSDLKNDTESIKEDTMFEEKERSSPYDESRGSESNYSVASSDSEGVVVARSPHPRPASVHGLDKNVDIVRVVISSINLNENADYILEDDNINLLFVEFGWPGIPREETETVSLPKPKLNYCSSYNFQKVIHVDYEDHLEQRQMLAAMLLGSADGLEIVRFTIVTEPENSDEVDDTCIDIGFATVQIPDILDNNQDIIDEDIPIYSTEDEALVIGFIKLTVECLAALKAIKMEIKE